MRKMQCKQNTPSSGTEGKLLCFSEPRPKVRKHPTESRVREKEKTKNLNWEKLTEVDLNHKEEG